MSPVDDVFLLARVLPEIKVPHPNGEFHSRPQEFAVMISGHNAIYPHLGVATDILCTVGGAVVASNPQKCHFASQKVHRKRLLTLTVERAILY